MLNKVDVFMLNKVDGGLGLMMGLGQKLGALELNEERSDERIGSIEACKRSGLVRGLVLRSIVWRSKDQRALPRLSDLIEEKEAQPSCSMEWMGLSSSQRGARAGGNPSGCFPAMRGMAATSSRVRSMSLVRDSIQGSHRSTLYVDYLLQKGLTEEGVSSGGVSDGRKLSSD